MRRRLAIVIGSLLGCGEPAVVDEPEPVAFAEVCGETGPVRVFRFEPWRRVEYASMRGVFGDRRLVSVSYADTDVAGSTLWSVGLCGEDPRLVYSDKYFTSSNFEPYLDQPFICDAETGEVHVLDVTGERPPRSVFQLGPGSCSFERTDAGLVFIRADADSETGQLVLLAWPQDVWTDVVEPVVLLDQVKTHWASPGASPWEMIQGDDGYVFVVNGDDELILYSFEDHSTEVVAAGVRRFMMSWEPADDEDGWTSRYLLWQSSEQTNDDPEMPEGELVLLDRWTNEQTTLGQGWLDGSLEHPFSWSDWGLMYLEVRVGDELVPRLYRLPTLTYVELPTSLDYDDMLADGRHLLARLLDDKSVVMVDSETGDWERIQGNPIARIWADFGLLALLPDAKPGDGAHDSELWMRDAAGELELWARRASYYHRILPDERVLTSVALDSESIGDLILVDPATLEERLVAREVLASSVMAPRTVENRDEIVYTILEPGREGVWVARLQPRE